MKCLFFDESGDSSTSDTFVMCGVLIDADKLDGSIDVFNAMFAKIYEEYKINVKEFKTSSFFKCSEGWQRVELTDQVKIIRQICSVIKSEKIKIYGTAISLKETKNQLKKRRVRERGKMDYWHASGVLMCASVQEKMSSLKKEIGNCLIISDDQNKVNRLNELLHKGDPWFGNIYSQKSFNSRSAKVQSTHKNSQFDRIINKTVVRINSRYSPHIQVADILCYIYRNHIECLNCESGETCNEKIALFSEVAGLMDNQREKFGKFSQSDSGTFYTKVTKKGWKI